MIYQISKFYVKLKGNRISVCDNDGVVSDTATWIATLGIQGRVLTSPRLI